MRIWIELKRGENANVVLNNLYKHTPLQSTFGANMVALVDGSPRTLGLKALLRHYVDHQREVITRRTKFRLERAERRAHILEGYLIALDNLDEVIELIRRSRRRRGRPRRARRALRAVARSRPRPSSTCACSASRAWRQGEIRAEHAELVALIAELRGDPGRRARGCSG